MIDHFTIKETFVNILMECGYDVWSACELAHDKIEEIKKLPPGSVVKVSVGNYIITITVKG